MADRKPNTVSRILHIDLDDETALELYNILNNSKESIKGWHTKTLLYTLRYHIGQTCDNCNHFKRELEWGDIINCGHPSANFQTTDAKAFRKDGCPMWESKTEKTTEE